MSAVTRSVATSVVTYGTSVKTIHQYLLDIFATTEGGLYDAYLPTLYQDSAGTTAVTTDEQPVGRWTDRSPNGFNLVQATAAARPTYRVDANGLPYVALLGTDDNMTSATGGGGSAGFFFCAAIRPTGGNGTIRRIFDDKGTNTGYRLNINTANELAFGASNGAAETLISSAATVAVGTSYVLAAWDDGTNLNVQINNGAVASIARPVVVAGTAGFTIGKVNGAAGGYLIADVYHMCYAKNTGLTASQRETEKRYAASKIGITL
ncbi:MAG: LamG-like jellyroll fold domain-containing protein [Gallionella sp.]|jgi:hypothetical protein